MLHPQLLQLMFRETGQGQCCSLLLRDLHTAKIVALLLQTMLLRPFPGTLNSTQDPGKAV